MKIKYSLFILTISISAICSAQITEEALHNMLDYDPEDSYIGTITVGILQGGGSLIGADMEFIAWEHYGFQLGAGFFGYGGALNFHPGGGIRSSFISLGYWHQGIDENYVQSLIGPTFVFRGARWFTAQIGIGHQIEEGPQANQINFNFPKTQLLYSIGAYFPIK